MTISTDKEDNIPWHHFCLYITNMNNYNDMEWYPMLNNTCIELEKAIPPGKVSIVGNSNYDIIPDWILGVQFYGNYQHFPSKVKYYGDDECNLKIIYEQTFYYKTYFNQLTINNQTIIELIGCISIQRLIQKYTKSQI